jgi:signal transduction histidine kinase
VARIAVLVLLLAVGSLLTDQPLWPPFSSIEPIALLIWTYGIFALIAAATLMLHRPAFAQAALLADILFLTLLTYYNETRHDLFYPLYVLPLVGAAIQMRRGTAMSVGTLAALGYGAAFLLSYASDSERTVVRDTLGLVALILRCAVMIFIPWLANGLAERTSQTNRRSVELAEQKRQVALDDANMYRARARALYEVAYTLSTSPTNQSILDSMLSEGRKLVDYTCGVVLLATGTQDELFVATSMGVTAQERQQTIRLGTGPVSQALREAEPFVLEDMTVEPIFQPLPTLSGCRAACAVPLRSGVNRYGALIVGGVSPNTFTEDRVEMLAALANYSLVALQNAQLIGDLRGERSKLLSKEEEVRHQLARDLHDGPAQALAAITMNVEFIKRMLERDPSRVVPELDKLSTLAKRTTHEVRTMLFELRPLALETQGLGETLRQYFERFQSNTTEIMLEAEGLTVQLDVKSEGTLFNIIQEAVNNALKHARAQHIWVRVKQNGTTLETVIQDDGRGFDVQKVKDSYEKRGSFGLLNIEERAQLIGGTAELRSAPGTGTTVRILVPII